MLYTVIDHAAKELTDLSTPTDHDNVPREMCSSALTPDPTSSSTVAYKVAIIVVSVFAVVIVLAVIILCTVIIVNHYHSKKEKNDHI